MLLTAVGFLIYLGLYSCNDLAACLGSSCAYLPVLTVIVNIWACLCLTVFGW